MLAFELTLRSLLQGLQYDTLALQGRGITSLICLLRLLLFSLISGNFIVCLYRGI